MSAISYQLILFLSCISLIRGPSAPTHLLLIRAGPCEASNKSVINVSELSISTHTYDSLLSGTMNISEDIENGWQVKATMQKCVDIRNIDTCDFFRKFFVVKNGCSDEEEEENMYTLMFLNAHPKLECPVQAGHYKILKYPLFTEDNYFEVYESKISTNLFGYTIRLDGYSVDHRKIFCVEAHLQLIYMRIHEWIENAGIQGTTVDPTDEGGR